MLQRRLYFSKPELRDSLHYAYMRPKSFDVRCGVIIRERVNAGLARAKERGTRLGRRPVKSSVEARIRELRAEGMGILKIGRTLGVGTSVVQRVLAAPSA